MARKVPIGLISTNMKQLRYYYLLLCLGCLVACNSCETDPNGTTGNGTTVTPAKPKSQAPDFSADSAYAYVKKQVDFGPRVPGTPEHAACKDWLVSSFEAYADRVIKQEGAVQVFDGKKINFTNIIASFNPEATTRILLCAHWDTRPFADHDQDPANHQKPILGANDAGSGVGVLLEIARVLKSNPVKIGVDIVLFDVEDYGQPDFAPGPRKADTYALGSQYWSKNPHVGGYQAKYGILLDMVGASNSRFRIEGYSNQFASNIVQKVWSIGNELGYGFNFPYENGPPIQDDHFYINTVAGIPTVDIIHLENNGYSTFHSSWHTLKDDMSVIDPTTLKAVGQTVLTVVYREDRGEL